MKFAYADPPYPGMAHLYKDHPDYAGEVDHAELIARLVRDYPDGWALSTSQTALQSVIALCPKDVRCLAWIKPAEAPRPFIKSHVIYSWEPVLYRGGRDLGWRFATRNYIIANAIMTRGRFVGAKPEHFSFWLFRCLGLLPGDTLDDLFPGSGAVSRAWDKYQRQMTLPSLEPKLKQLKLTND